jgi:sugar phosphate isomerase/epimerase
MISLGIRAHDFGKLPVKELARKLSSFGLTGIQLAPGKAIEGINADTGSFSPGLASHLRQEFESQGIRVAVLGCYVNIVHPDLAERGRLLARFKEHLRFARDFGCSMVATETASLNADWSYHPENGSERAFAEAVKSVAELVAEAEKFGVLVAIEGVSTHVMHSPRRLRQLLDSISSNNLQILFDPVNLLSLKNWSEQDRLMKESFDLFGERIVAIHAKDFRIENGIYRSVPAGLGQLNYPLLKDLLRQRKSYIDVLLEETTVETLPTSIACLRS